MYIYILSCYIVASFLHPIFHYCFSPSITTYFHTSFSFLVFDLFFKSTFNLHLSFFLINLEFSYEYFSTLYDFLIWSDIPKLDSSNFSITFFFVSYPLHFESVLWGPPPIPLVVFAFISVIYIPWFFIFFSTLVLLPEFCFSLWSDSFFLPCFYSLVWSSGWASGTQYWIGAVNLAEQTFCVSLRDHLSYAALLSCGVPQGSVLAPPLLCTVFCTFWLHTGKARCVISLLCYG